MEAPQYQPPPPDPQLQALKDKAAQDDANAINTAFLQRRRQDIAMYGAGPGVGGIAGVDLLARYGAQIAYGGSRNG